MPFGLLLNVKSDREGATIKPPAEDKVSPKYAHRQALGNVRAGDCSHATLTVEAALPGFVLLRRQLPRACDGVSTPVGENSLAR